MSQSAEDTIRGLYDAFARADVAALLNALDEQIDWRCPANLPHGGHFVGREGVGRFFQGIGEHWETLNVEIDELLVGGDRVVVLSTARGRLRTGEDSGYTAAHSWTLTDGIPTRFAETVDAPLSLPTAAATV